MKNFKKWMSLALGLTMLSASVMGCGGVEEASSAESEQKTEETIEVSKEEAGSEVGGEKTELRIWHGFTSESTKAAVEDIFERYNEVQDEVTIVYDSFSSADLLQAYTLGAVSGELPDIGTYDSSTWQTLCEMGVWTDLNDWYNQWEDHDKIMPSIQAAGYYNDDVYGVPFGPNCLALWCNTELLKEAGYDKPPKTVEEFVEIAKATTNAEKGVYGYVMGAMKREDVTFQTIPWLKSAGGDVFDLTSAESEKAMNMLRGLYEEGAISQECLNLSQSDALNQFIAGNAAMYLSGSWNVATIRKEAPDLKFTCSAIPKDQDSITILGGELIGITSQCKNVEAAQDFIEWFLSEEINTEFCQRCTRFSPRTDVSVEDLYPGDEVMAVYADLLTNAYARGPHPAWSDISSVFQTTCQEIYSGAKDTATSLQEAAAQIQAIDSEYK